MAFGQVSATRRLISGFGRITHKCDRFSPQVIWKAFWRASELADGDAGLIFSRSTFAEFMRSMNAVTETPYSLVVNAFCINYIVRWKGVAWCTLAQKHII